jgi:hypothetical protein
MIESEDRPESRDATNDLPSTFLDRLTVVRVNELSELNPRPRAVRQRQPEDAAGFFGPSNAISEQIVFPCIGNRWVRILLRWARSRSPECGDGNRQQGQDG